ncbi:MAG: phosphoribosylformylglycinamidine cyclo-ligase [Candidatus Marinimicrobia bacterium]|nr:phosphoribosylformylglycinamidine cyclo-ligase [Candidatus Neomarinimicrobiota bacterium]
MNKKITYKDAGVDIKKADEAIEMSKKEIINTFSKDVLSSIGGFGSMYSLKDILNNFEDPVLVQSIDGVGTKMSVAMAANNFQFIGHDLVNACCNDVAATGAEPLTFLDYVAGSNLDKNIVSDVIKSVAHECKERGVSLVGGETAEMPGTYHKDEYDLVGVATGVVERKNIVDGSNVKAGDVAVGVFSNGLHTNGYSLARKLIFETLELSISDILPGHDISIKDCLLAPHMNYSSLIKGVLKEGINIKSISHITGGGLIDNVPRVIPKNVSLEVNINSWGKIPVFDFLQRNLNIDKKDLYQTFNMGIGLVFIVEDSEKDMLISFIGKNSCSKIGVIVDDGLNVVHLND